MNKIKISGGLTSSTTKILIDGNDISRAVTYAQLTLKAGSINELTLVLIADFEIDIDGAVYLEAGES